VEDLGFPIRCVRTYAVALRKESLVWVGTTDLKELAKDFLRYFARVTMLDADTYAGLDTPEAAFELRVQLARLRGIYQGVEEMDLEALLPPTARDAYAKLSSEDRACSGASASGGLVADVSQTFLRRRAGAWLPALTSSSKMMSVSKKHLFTPNELNFAMGWPMFAMSKSNFSHKLTQTLPGRHASISPNHLPGTGMMLAQVMTFFVYVMAHTVRKDVVMKVMMPSGNLGMLGRAGPSVEKPSGKKDEEGEDTLSDEEGLFFLSEGVKPEEAAFETMDDAIDELAAAAAGSSSTPATPPTANATAAATRRTWTLLEKGRHAQGLPGSNGV
jgi:hypothetical protein